MEVKTRSQRLSFTHLASVDYQSLEARSALTHIVMPRTLECEVSEGKRDDREREKEDGEAV